MILLAVLGSIGSHMLLQESRECLLKNGKKTKHCRILCVFAQ